MYKFLIIVFLFFVQNHGFCQEKSSLQNGNNSQNPLYFESKLSGEVFISDYGYVGNPYFINAWSKGDVTLRTRQVVHNKWLRYNGVSDDLIWRTDSSFQEVKLDKNLISEFVLANNHQSVQYFFRKIRVPSWIKNDTIEVFAQLLGNTDLIYLYEIRKVIIEGHVPQEVSGKLILKQQLSPDPYYYLVIQGKPGLKFRKANRKTILSMFPEFADKIKSLMKEHGNKLRTDDEMIEMVKLISNVLKKE
jgi:hypothetical protein